MQEPGSGENASTEPREASERNEVWDVFQSLGRNAQPGRLDDPSTGHDRFLIRRFPVKELFVDTSTWMAIADANDVNHPAAVAFQSQMSGPRRLIVTNYILDELYTLILMDLGYRQAVGSSRSSISSAQDICWRQSGSMPRSALRRGPYLSDTIVTSSGHSQIVFPTWS